MDWHVYNIMFLLHYSKDICHKNDRVRERERETQRKRAREKEKRKIRKGRNKERKKKKRERASKAPQVAFLSSDLPVL